MKSELTPAVTIVVPALNEEAYIADCLASLIGQAESAGGELLVMDGGSSDRTRQIVRSIGTEHAALRLLDNPRRTQSAALNLAARLSTAPVLLRADAHASYPDDFVASCLQALRAQDATSVVVPMVTVGRTGFQLAVASAQNSVLGNGGSAHRRLPRAGFVAHGHHAAFDRAFFLHAGGYDEGFTHNEDAELDHRAAALHGRIWMCPEAAVTYYPRSNLISLARQYFRHGRGRARMLRKHRLLPRPRQMAPVAAFVLVVAGLALAPSHPAALLLPIGYGAVCVIWGAAAAWPWQHLWQAASGIAAITMHMAWAAGFLAGAVHAALMPQPAKGTEALAS